MKKPLLIIAMLVVTTGIANAHECSAPIAPALFKQKFNHIVAMRSDQHRLEDARALVSRNCLLSRHVKQIALLFHDDRDRLEFAKAAYLTTFDKPHFYDVYDAFTHFSSAFRLHDYVLMHKTETHEIVPVTKPATILHEFPAYDYPSAVNYSEEKYCERPVQDRTFHGVVGKVIRQPNDVEKIKTATRYAAFNCLSVAQVMKIGSMIESESNRLIYLKTMFDNVYDMMNYGYCDQLFSSAEY
ncbi:MAG: DUF4476 domain-containing protein, partial [Flavobacteriales bacterium]|nr:DUF4476 domain-containing protein [Flavobacteriales bacterium]